MSQSARLAAVVAYVAGKGGTKADAEAMWTTLSFQYAPTTIMQAWDQMESAWNQTPTGQMPQGSTVQTWNAP